MGDRHPYSSTDTARPARRRERCGCAPGPSVHPDLHPARKHTCVFLRQHRPAYNFLKSRNPLQLVVLGLAGEEKFPIRGDDGYPVLPVVSLRGRREPFQDLVAVFLAANKNFPSGKGILGDSEGAAMAKGSSASRAARTRLTLSHPPAKRSSQTPKAPAPRPQPHPSSSRGTHDTRLAPGTENSAAERSAAVP